VGTTVTALMTCHDRVERTLACLASLDAQQGLGDASVSVVLVDAGSTDGTREAVTARYPDVRVVARGPELFWNGGMRVAQSHAVVDDPDHYLWLNDDVELDPDAVATLLDTDRELRTRRGAPAIVVGSTRDPASGRLTYGGVVRPDRRRPLSYELVPPSPDRPRRVETMNGNCVLVPRAVARRIGTLAAAYTHGMGDYDYGHRAALAGCEVWLAPGTVGTCSRNPPAPRAATLAEHRRRATGTTTGLPPSEWFTFARRWAGPLWPLYAVSPYVRRFAAWARASTSSSG
jgi:GT2 family glycosyltransferase